MVGGFGGVARLAQLAVEFFQLVGALGYPPLQFLVHGLQALLGLDPFGDVGDETFDQLFLVVPEQQVHQYLDVTAVPAPEARLVAEQAAALAQHARIRRISASPPTNSCPAMSSSDQSTCCGSS